MLRKILSLGWKNVWRNPTRSGVVIISVLLGTWAGIFISAFFNGMIQDYLQNELELSVGHVQVEHNQYQDLQNPAYFIPNPVTLINSLDTLSYVDHIRYESLVTGLAQSAINGFGVNIHGLPENSNTEISHPLNKYIKEGAFLSDVSTNPIMVGLSLADRLDLDMKSKVILNFQDIDGNITAGVFRVSGIFDTYNDRFEQGNVYVKRDDLNSLLGHDQAVHIIKLQLKDFTKADQVVESLGIKYPNLTFTSWGETAPELQYVFDTMDISLYVIMVIIITALVFSIINTMLMAVLERTKELGMLMALGMNHSRIFTMIIAETFFLTMVGTPLGFLLSWITVSYFEQTGIRLTAFSEGLSAYGLGTVIHPTLNAGYYVDITLLIIVAAFLSALYPAWKTIRLNPVEAIRKI